MQLQIRREREREMDPFCPSPSTQPPPLEKKKMKKKKERKKKKRETLEKRTSQTTLALQQVFVVVESKFAELLWSRTFLSTIPPRPRGISLIVDKDSEERGEKNFRFIIDFILPTLPCFGPRTSKLGDSGVKNKLPQC